TILYFLKKQNYPSVFYLTVGFICGIMIFGFPLTNALLDNPKFQSYTDLRKKIQEKEIPLYLYQTSTPELIWDYGSPIPVLSEDELDQVGNHFGLLLEEKDAVILKELNAQYLIKSSERYDLNQVAPGSSGYK